MAPLPLRHTLPVEDPASLERGMFGNIRVDPPRVAVVPEDIHKEIDEEVREARRCKLQR